MRRLAFLLAMFAGFCVYGQIGVKLESNYQSYLRYEPVRLRVTLTNLTGNTLVFGGKHAREAGRLIFDVTALSGRHVKNLDLEANPVSDMIMAPGESRSLYVRLNTMFDLQREDTYVVRAIISHNRLSTKYQSEEVSLDIRDGLTLDERTLGMPSANAHDMIESMKVILFRFNGKDGSLYCLRAEDKRHVYGTFRLGPFIMGSQQAQMEIENGNSIHILMQVAPRLFCYTTFSVANHDIRKRQEMYYTAAGGVPRLSRETGYLKVHNVRPALVGKDYNKEAETPFGDER